MYIMRTYALEHGARSIWGNKGGGGKGAKKEKRIGMKQEWGEWKSDVEKEEENRREKEKETERDEEEGNDKRKKDDDKRGEGKREGSPMKEKVEKKGGRGRGEGQRGYAREYRGI